MLVPPSFDGWQVLREYGLGPVNPAGFLRAQSLPLALGALERQGISPDRSTVALRGQRADREMARAAVALSARVRRLVISAPRGGRELANWLRWEFGVPILPEQATGEVALCFAPEDEAASAELTLELYGQRPNLGGLNVWAPELDGEDQSDLPLLAALWQGGRLACERVKIT